MSKWLPLDVATNLTGRTAQPRPHRSLQVFAAGMGGTALSGCVGTDSKTAGYLGGRRTNGVDTAPCFAVVLSRLVSWAGVKAPRTLYARDAAAIRAFDIGRPHCHWVVLKLVSSQPQRT